MNRITSPRPTTWSAIRSRLRHTQGAIDLFSIMVGVIVISVIAAGISATVFGVIPWAQDETAKRDVNAVQLAQGVARVKDGSGTFKTVEELVDGGYLANPNSADPDKPQKIFVALGQNSKCYVVGSRSQTGKVFYATSASNKVKPYIAGQANGSECADISGQAETQPAAKAGVMKTTWDTTDANCKTIMLPVGGMIGSGTVDWGDGVTTPLSEQVSHTYSTDGVKTVTVNGAFVSYGTGRMFEPCLTAVSEWSGTKTTNLSNAFTGSYNLTSFPAVFDASQVTDMSGMFVGTGITTLPTVFDTHKVTNMSDMFNGSSISALPASFKTGNVTNMSGMFSNSKIVTLPEVLDTSKVTDMSNMFNGTTIASPPAVLDVGAVTNMSGMFTNSRVAALPSVFDTSGVKNMAGMFADSRITALPSVFDTSRVTNMAWMFADSRITNLPSVFDTSGVTDMSYMFQNAAFTSLPPFNTDQVTDMTGMFVGSLIAQNFSGWNVDQVVNHDRFSEGSAVLGDPVWKN